MMQLLNILEHNLRDETVMKIIRNVSDSDDSKRKQDYITIYGCNVLLQKFLESFVKIFYSNSFIIQASMNCLVFL